MLTVLDISYKSGMMHIDFVRSHTRESLMARVEKVKELLDASNISKILTMMVDTTAQTYCSRLGDDSSRSLEEMRQFNSRLLDKIQPRILELMSALYAKHFTDDELDAMIAIHKMPVFVKMQVALPEIQRDFLATFTSPSFIDMDKVVREIEEEMIWDNIIPRINEELEAGTKPKPLN